MAELIDKHHFEELTQRDPHEVCMRLSCSFDAARNCYELPIWGNTYAIYPTTRKVECTTLKKQPHEYFSLFAVHYLLTAKNILSANQWISEKDMPGGVTFFRGPHEIPTRLITQKVRDSTEDFQELARKHNGLPLDMADTACIFHITDRIPVAVLYWAGDDDFPAESKILYDKTLTEHFALDIVFALAVGICEELGRQ